MTTLEARNFSSPPGQPEAPPQPKPPIAQERSPVGAPLGGAERNEIGLAACRATLLSNCQGGHTEKKEADSTPTDEGVSVNDLAGYLRARRQAVTEEERALGVDCGADTDNPYR